MAWVSEVVFLGRTEHEKEKNSCIANWKVNEMFQSVLTMILNTKHGLFKLSDAKGKIYLLEIQYKGYL